LALALLAWSSISFISALDPSLALRQLGLLAGGILLACTVIAVCESMDDIRQTLGGFVVVGTAVALVGVFSEGSLQTYYGGTVVSGRSVGTFQQSNQFGSFTLMAAAAAVGLVLGARSRVARLAAGIATSVLLAGVLLSLSRGAWIATIGAFVFLLVALPNAGRLAKVLLPCLMVAAILIAATSSSALQVLQLRADALTERSPYDHRSLTWEEARREIAKRPIFGEGPGNFRVASLSSASMAAPLHDEHAHNIWLEWAAGTGIPGAAILTAFVVGIAAAVRRASRVAQLTRDRTVIVAVGAALLTVVIHGFFDYTLTHDVIWLSVWFLIGTGLAAHRISAGAGDNVKPRSSGRLLADPF
jgi:O-antigen ligase